MSSNKRIILHIFTFILLLVPSLALNADGVLLLSFKYSILSDPLSVLQSWNYDDATPCSWTGVTCTQIGSPGTPNMFRVTSLILPNSKLLGSISTDLGFIEHLQHLDLSSNFFNGSLPTSLFNSTELQVLSLSSNKISGELPESINGMTSLQLLNLSDNALAGNVPQNLTALQNLTVVSLRSNYFSGSLPGGFNSIEVLDLSSNLFNGTLPLDFGGSHLRYLNLSYNKISGAISPEFAKKIPGNASIDLSFNNLTGAIPESMALLNQKTASFSGNLELCGKPLKNLCSIPSTLSAPPNVTSTTTPAIAVIPKTVGSNPSPNTPNSPQNNNQQQPPQSGLKPGTIAVITVADLAGLALLAMVILYVYQLKKRKHLTTTSKQQKTEVNTITKPDQIELKKPQTWSCLTLKMVEETSEATTTSSDSDQDDHQNHHQTSNKGGMLVTVDGETELELETLLKASAYILGATGSSIVYKAVLEDGTALAVRRIGGESCGVDRFKDFESHVRLISKLKHPNLVKVRGFYWGDDEKLVIYDYVDNGSLCTSRKPGSSPSHLPLEVRLKIARGVARGVSYIHEKKHVHGNLKPTNILLSSDMEPIITDFGLDRLILSNNSYKAAGNSSTRHHFGSQRAITTSGSQDLTTGSSPYTPPATSSSSATLTSHYQAPESLKNLKPNPKWDVYSFGTILLELLSGRVFTDRELAQWTDTAGSVGEEEKNRIFMRMVDPVIRADMEGREEAMLVLIKLGFSCASFVAQKRPSMKEALQILEKISSTTSISSC